MFSALSRNPDKIDCSDLEKEFLAAAPPDCLLRLKFSSEIHYVVAEATATRNNLQSFLNSDWSIRVRQRGVGPNLIAANIFRDHLLQLTTLTHPATMTTGMVLELCSFAESFSLCRKSVFESLTQRILDISVKTFNKRVANLKKKFSNLKKSPSAPNAPEKMSCFLSSIPNFKLVAPTPAAQPTTSNFPLSSELQSYVAAQSKLACTRRKLEEEQNRAGELQICMNSLQEELQTVREEKRVVEVELEQVQSEVVSLRSTLDDAIERALTAEVFAKELKGGATYKNLKRREAKLKDKENVIFAHEHGGCARTIVKLRKDKKNLQ